MSTPQTFPELLALWKPLNRLADDVGLPEQTVYGWQKRGFIDLPHWDALILAARKRHRLRLSKDALHKMASAALKERQPRKQDAA